MSVRVLALLATSIGWSWAGTASAHPLVDEGRARLDDAQFGEALDAFARAEAASDLEVADLALLYESRAMAYDALGDVEARNADLARLVSISPGHELSSGVPPRLREAFARVRGQSPGPLRIDADAEPVARGVSISASAAHDEARLVRDLTLRGRADGETEWTVAHNAPLFVAAPPGRTVEYYVEAIGPGGAVLARAGTDERPLRAASESLPPPTSEAEDGGPSAWLWVGIGAGVVAIAAAIVAIVLVTSSQQANGPTNLGFCVEGWSCP